MNHIELIDNLSIKKLDPKNEIDLWLVRQLDKEYSEFFYLIEAYFYQRRYSNLRYLKKNDIYDAIYGIFFERHPVGFFEISLLEKLGWVDVACKLLNSEQKKGYATKTLREITKIILNDRVENIKKVITVIDPNNFASQAVVKRAGFISDGLSDLEHEEQGFIQYEKTKDILKIERG